MENLFNNFIDYKISKRNDILIFLFDVKKEQPSPFEWTCAIEEFKEKMDEIEKLNINFVYVLDIRLMGLLSIAQIKEFSALLLERSVFIEKRLICSTAVADGAFIKQLFEIVKIFYKTIKPLKIVNTMEESNIFIEECKLKFK
jgi:hypothetical protein